MELVASLDAYMWPPAAFRDPTTYTFLGIIHEEYEQRNHPNTSSLLWETSCTNPSKLANCFRTTRLHGWRLDGCSVQGTRFYAVPTKLAFLPVRRIDVYLPCQSRCSASLRRSLELSSLINTDSKILERIEITRYICAALEKWSSSINQFPEIYASLPLNSCIYFENIVADIESVKLRLVPNQTPRSDQHTLETLKQMWSGIQIWPDSIPLELLILKRLPSDAISVVEIPSLHGETQFILKSSSSDMLHLYHELRLLLSMVGHPHIIAKPVYIVVDKTTLADDAKVIGFILKFISGQTLRDYLENEQMRLSTTLEQRYTWSLDITSTLLSILQGPCLFYSDLKPDNIMLAGKSKTATIIDFEQAGNWPTFSAPEIVFVEWLERLLDSDIDLGEKRDKFTSLLEKTVTRVVERKSDYDNPDHGYFSAWICLAPDEREAAMVYSLGMILWCIFEHTSHTRDSVDEAFNRPTPVEFPAFNATPPALRGLIERCTRGHEVITQSSKKLKRMGSRVFCCDGSGQIAEDQSPRDVLYGAKSMWCEKLDRMENYMEARCRWKAGVPEPRDELVLGHPLRPSLEEVRTLLQREIERL